MGARGPTQKSLKAMELAGTARPARPRQETLPSIPLQYVPDPPAWLDGDEVATKEWRWLAPLLIADGTLAEKDLRTLANLCAVQSRIIRNFRGEDVTVVGCHSTYARYASALGLGVAWRARVASNGDKDKSNANQFEQFKTN